MMLEMQGAELHGSCIPDCKILNDVGGNDDDDDDDDENDAYDDDSDVDEVGKDEEWET